MMCIIEESGRARNHQLEDGGSFLCFRPGTPRRTILGGMIVMSGKKILVVEDSENIRKIIKFMLVQRGYEVLEGRNGFEAERLAKTQRPDLILLDVMLPDKTGFEICTELKANPQYAGIKIVMLTAITKGTGKSDLYWKDKCKADGFLSKPFRAKDVLETIEKLLAADPGRGNGEGAPSPLSPV